MKYVEEKNLDLRVTYNNKTEPERRQSFKIQ